MWLAYQDSALDHTHISASRIMACFTGIYFRWWSMFLSFVQGAGAFEVAARQHLINEVKKTVQGVKNVFQNFCCT